MGIGLCLSGGGFRATLFNLGSLWRLNDAGQLPQIGRITSVSGGSIASGCLAAFWSDLTFDQTGVATNFGDVVANRLRSLCARTLDQGAIIGGVLKPWSSTNIEIAKRYDKYLFSGRRLADIPPSGAAVPEFLFYATSLQTGSSVRITREYLRDYKVGDYPIPDLALAEVVGCSSAFPPLLSPRVLKFKADRWKELPGAELFSNESYRTRLFLTDGGVYDNMGMEAVWRHEDYPTVLVSDAGAPQRPAPKPARNWISQYFRVNGVVMEQARAVRKRWLLDRYQRDERRGTYWGIGTTIADFGLPDPLLTDSATTVNLRFMRTRLNAFSPQEQKNLINWGYALCDAALRCWVDRTMARGKLPINE